MPSRSPFVGDSFRPEVRRSRAARRAAGVAALLWCVPVGHAAAQVVDRYQPLERMHHTAWTARDGLAGVPSSLTQTADGFLWIGTSDGLYRFDGMRLEAYHPARGAMAARAVSALAAAPDGGLWVGHQNGGVTFIDATGSATSYSPADSLPVARVRALAVDLDGTVWVAAVGGLARLPRAATQWQKVRSDWGYPNLSAWSVFVDRRGTVWVGAASPNGVRFLPRGGRRFVDLAVSGSALGFGELDDSTLVYAHQQAPTMHVVRWRGDTATVLQDVADLPSAAITVDGERGVWIAGHGALRLRLTARPGGGAFETGPVEHFTHAQGVSGELGSSLLVDREGTVWMTTREGLDRFRRRNLAWDRDSTLRAGASVVTDSAGGVWLLSFREPALRRGLDGAPVPGAPTPIDNGFVDRDGHFWLSNQRELFRWDGTDFHRVAPPREVEESNLRFTVTATTQDGAGRLWVSVSGSGVFSRRDSTWTFREILQGRPDMSPTAVETDAQGRVWLAYRDELAMVDGDRVQVYTGADGLDLGPLTSVRSGSGRVWATGERGFAAFRGDRFHTVNTVLASGLSLGSVTGAVATSAGLWLTTTVGIGFVGEAELQRLDADPATRVPVELFDLASDLPDQLRFAGRHFRWGTEGGDGVLWFVTQAGIARVDPRRIVRNTVPPPIAFRSVVADDSAYSPHGEIRLPPLTRTLRIDFTALSLVMPERVRFRHRLQGWEDEWHEASDRREVTYTDLRPGRYTLLVRASNNDGVWNETGVGLPFSVAPAWFQTTTFRAVVALLLAGAMVAAYRYRIRRVSAALALRYDERLAERTRIARELHDTLLQTVQGSKMVADDVLDRPNEVEHLREALRRVSGWLGQAAEEGRAALHSLRVTESEWDLADALRRSADDPTRPQALAVAVHTRGTPRPLHPLVQTEIHRIGIEGIRNTFLHAAATRLTIELEYGHDLVLRLTDDGMGIDPAVARAGKQGRFGIAGMRERATNIGGTLTVDAANPGTRVTLVVPGSRVFGVGAHASPSREHPVDL